MAQDEHDKSPRGLNGKLLAYMHFHHYMQFFTGPESPGSHQPRRLATSLAARGHHVDVIACDMNAYSEQLEPEEIITFPTGGCVRVHRLPVARGMRTNLQSRLKTYLGFAHRAYRYGRRLKRPDAVIASIQPLFTGLVGVRIARRAHAPLLLEVRDLWPDALEAKGSVTGLKSRGLHLIADYVYRHADRIVSLTPGIKLELVHKGYNPLQIDVFPNGFDPGLFGSDRKPASVIRTEYGWNRRFLALYTGTHTEVTAVHVIVKAAAVLKDHPDIHFALVGKGQTKASAMELAKQLDLKNISFHDPVPRVMIPDLIAACDVGVMTLFTSRLEHIYFENKFVDYMGAGCPIVAAMGGLQAQLINRYETGRVVPAFDDRGLAALVEEAFQNPDKYRLYGINGKQFVEKHLMLPDILTRYCQRIEEVARRQYDEPAWEPFPMNAGLPS